MNIDIHSHVMPKETFNRAGQYGPDWGCAGDGYWMRLGKMHLRGIKTRAMRDAYKRGEFDPAEWESKYMDPDLRLEEMDARGIDIMGVTITPLFYLYWIEPEINIEYARIQNDALARFCRGREDRLFFMPTLPLQDIEASVREVDRAIGELGGKAINVGGSGIAGHELGDEHFWPVYERLVAHDVPLVIHPYPTDQVERARGVAPDEPDPYQIHPILEYVFQETVAFHTLLFSGALDEFPTLKVYIPHGGGFIPYQFGRIEAFAPVSGCRAKRPLRSYLPNFYFDTLVHDVASRQHLVDWAGADNVLVGDNFEGIDSADGFALTDELDLSDADKEKIKSLNAKRLFKL